MASALNEVGAGPPRRSGVRSAVRQGRLEEVKTFEKTMLWKAHDLEVLPTLQVPGLKFGDV